MWIVARLHDPRTHFDLASALQLQLGVAPVEVVDLLLEDGDVDHVLVAHMLQVR